MNNKQELRLQLSSISQVIDWHNKFKPCHGVVLLDLREAEAQTRVFKQLEDHNVQCAYVLRHAVLLQEEEMSTSNSTTTRRQSSRRHTTANQRRKERHRYQPCFTRGGAKLSGTDSSPSSLGVCVDGAKPGTSTLW